MYRSASLDPTNDPPSAFWNRFHDPAMLSYLNTFRFRWFGSWIHLHDVGHGATLKWGARRTAREYARQVQLRGGPDALVPVTIFRLDPFEHPLIFGHHVATRAQQRELPRLDRPVPLRPPGRPRPRRDRAPAGHAAHPRAPGPLEALHPADPLDGGPDQPALPSATTYIDAGASDWLSARRAAGLLKAAGVAGVRGFSLNITHYASTQNEVAYGRQIVRTLSHWGIRDKHFVVSTALNGRPFTHFRNKYTFKHGVHLPEPRSAPLRDARRAVHDRHRHAGGGRLPLDRPPLVQQRHAARPAASCASSPRPRRSSRPLPGSAAAAPAPGRRSPRAGRAAGGSRGSRPGR